MAPVVVQTDPVDRIWGLLVRSGFCKLCSSRRHISDSRFYRHRTTCTPPAHHIRATYASSAQITAKSKVCFEVIKDGV
jgi:hypothetical protein